MTAAEILQARSLARGRAEGKAELILRLLQRKFGVVPEAIQQRVLMAASDELDVWADRILTASQLDELP
jgi:hypothetical protein